MCLSHDHLLVRGYVHHVQFVYQKLSYLLTLRHFSSSTMQDECQKMASGGNTIFRQQGSCTTGNTIFRQHDLPTLFGSRSLYCSSFQHIMFFPQKFNLDFVSENHNPDAVLPISAQGFYNDHHPRVVRTVAGMRCRCCCC